MGTRLSIYFLEKRREIEGVYKELANVKSQMKALLFDSTDNLTSENIRLLELEEEKLLSKIVRLKAMLE